MNCSRRWRRRRGSRLSGRSFDRPSSHDRIFYRALCVGCWRQQLTKLACFRPSRYRFFAGKNNIASSSRYGASPSDHNLIGFRSEKSSAGCISRRGEVQVSKARAQCRICDCARQRRLTSSGGKLYNEYFYVLVLALFCYVRCLSNSDTRDGSSLYVGVVCLLVTLNLNPLKPNSSNCTFQM